MYNLCFYNTIVMYARNVHFICNFNSTSHSFSSYLLSASVRPFTARVRPWYRVEYGGAVPEDYFEVGWRVAGHHQILSPSLVRSRGSRVPESWPQGISLQV